jgi:hypothetical protein
VERGMLSALPSPRVSLNFEYALSSTRQNRPQAPRLKTLNPT